MSRLQGSHRAAETYSAARPQPADLATQATIKAGQLPVNSGHSERTDRTQPLISPSHLVRASGASPDIQRVPVS
jgi:hypothetical protein